MTDTMILAAIFTIAILALALIDKVQRRNVLRIKRTHEKDRPYHHDQSLGLDGAGAAVAAAISVSEGRKDPERKETSDGIQEKHSD